MREDRDEAFEAMLMRRAGRIGAGERRVQRLLFAIGVMAIVLLVGRMIV